MRIISKTYDEIFIFGSVIDYLGNFLAEDIKFELKSQLMTSKTTDNE